MAYGVQPDIVSTAKGLAGGLPLGATLLGEKVQNVLSTGTHGSTFGGNPVCCAGAISILNRLDDALLASVREKSDYVFRALLDAPGAGLAGALDRRIFGPSRVDYSQPKGDPGLYGPDSVAWRVHANPIALAIGGVAAVILELAEPRVRTGVWEHSIFARDPLTRMRRTGLLHCVLAYAFNAIVLAMAINIAAGFF